jgi:hypothetical protein
MENSLPSPEELRQLLRYEPETGKLFWRRRSENFFPEGKYGAKRNAAIWNTRHAGKEVSTVGLSGYIILAIYNKSYKAHRVAWAIHYDEWPNDQIDHINQNRRDNRICNLRIVTNKENAMNRTIQTNNKSGVVGVSWHKQRNKWIVRIASPDKYLYLGLFSNFADAVECRKEAERKYGYHPNHGARAT